MFLSLIIPTYFVVLCTAYSPTVEECGKTDGITASGIRAVEGETVAADDLPLGTKIEIGGKIYTVHDRFGAGHKNRVDIFMESQEDCFRFGKRYMAARIVSVPRTKKVDFTFKPFSSYYKPLGYFF